MSDSLNIKGPGSINYSRTPQETPVESFDLPVDAGKPCAPDIVLFNKSQITPNSPLGLRMAAGNPLDKTIDLNADQAKQNLTNSRQFSQLLHLASEISAILDSR